MATATGGLISAVQLHPVRALPSKSGNFAIFAAKTELRNRLIGNRLNLGTAGVLRQVDGLDRAAVGTPDPEINVRADAGGRAGRPGVQIPAVQVRLRRSWPALLRLRWFPRDKTVLSSQFSVLSHGLFTGN